MIVMMTNGKIRFLGRREVHRRYMLFKETILGLYYTIKIPSIYSIDTPFDLNGHRTNISLVVLPLDVLNLCGLQGIVRLRKYAHKSAVQRRDRKQTYLYYMLDILFTICVIIYEHCNSMHESILVLSLVKCTALG